MLFQKTIGESLLARFDAFPFYLFIYVLSEQDLKGKSVS